MKKLQNMSDDELMEEWTKAGAVFEDAKARVKEFSDEHQRRLTEQAVETRLAGMTDTEREVMAQMLSPVGIESEEAVNNG